MMCPFQGIMKCELDYIDEGQHIETHGIFTMVAAAIDKYQPPALIKITGCERHTMPMGM